MCDANRGGHPGKVVDETSSGYYASKDDLLVYLAFSQPPKSDLVNVSCWYNHISALLKKSLPGALVDVNITGVPAPVCDAASTVEATKEANDDDLDLSRKKLKRKTRKKLKRKRKLQLNAKLRRKLVQRKKEWQVLCSLGCEAMG